MQSNLERLAIETFTKRQADLELRADKVRVTDFKEHFVDGALVTIAFDSYKDADLQGKCENRVYIVDGKAKVFLTDRELITALEGPRRSILLEILSARMVSAIMALAMLGAMIWLVFTTSDKESSKLVLQTLAGAFGLAAGFFFAKTA